MDMYAATKAFVEAESAEAVIEAYEAMLEWYADDEDLPEDADFEAGVDKMLSDMGLPSLPSRLSEFAA